MRSREYWTEEIFTPKKLNNTIISIYDLMHAQNEKVVNDIFVVAGLSATTSWIIEKIKLTKNLGPYLGSCVFALYTLGKLSNAEYKSQIQDVLNNGLKNLKSIKNLVDKSGYSHVKINLAVCDCDNGIIIEGAELTAIKKPGGSGWITPRI
ncbi:hypothetical protein [Clostridium sp. KNHs214]|uniref:hypothetical protein n=1 Tax=Clostridium sp. KNHs214 TaxID=1540257 RepID=UPI0005536655|nr:hypothetical protein [Clostridium sp. KNHs214]